MDNKFANKCPSDTQKESYIRLMWKIIKNQCCLKCKSEIKQIWRWKFQCVKCDSKFAVKPERNLFVDMSDSRNWKSTCVECGGIMDYYNLRYMCRKCGSVLEV